MRTDLQQKIQQLRVDHTAALAAYDAQYMEPANWQHDLDKDGKPVRISSPLCPTPEGERLFSELAAKLRRLKQEIATAESQLDELDSL